MIPNSEVEALHRDAGAAVTLALAGEPQDGLEVLLAGLQRAQDLRVQERWAAELSECYGLAVSGFCSRYGLGRKALIPDSGLAGLR
jgi:hypothetical protein